MLPENLKVIRLAGICGILGPLIALILIFTAVAYSPWFVWEKDALSDLGVSDVAPLFNSAVIIAGILNLFFALGVRRSLGDTKLSNVGSMALILGGASLSLVGVFTLETPILHAAVSLGYFVIFPLALIIIGVAMMQGSSRSSGITTILAGVAALIAIFGVAPFYEGLAIPEILEALILAAWTEVMGVRLLRYEAKKG